MTALPISFNSAGHEHNSFEVIPPGSYPMMIVTDEMRDNARTDGRHLYMVLQITDGPHKGRQLFERLNLINGNAKAVTIALSTLASMTRAILGHDASVVDTSILHMRPFLGKVVVNPAKGDYGPSNSVADFARLGASTPPPPAQHTFAPAPPTAQSFNPAGNPFPQHGAPAAAASTPAQGSYPWPTN